MIYQSMLLPFLRGFDPQKYLEDFKAMSERQRAETFDDAGGLFMITSMIYITKYPDLVIQDIKRIDKGIKDEEPLLTEGLEKEIRAQGAVYKPYLETIYYLSDPKRYMTGEGRES